MPSLYNSFSEKISSLSSIVIIYSTQYGVFGLQFNYNNSTSSTFGVSQSALSSSGYNPSLVTISLAGSYIGSVTTCSGAWIDSFSLHFAQTQITALPYLCMVQVVLFAQQLTEPFKRYPDISTQQTPFYNTYMKYIAFLSC